jgi:hypothetical protein
MSSMADETLAFSVAEATMQDWLAAVLLAQQEPMPRRAQPHPVCIRPAFARPAPRIVLVRPVARTVVRPAKAETSGQVAGARTVYWLGLAAALAATLLF